jgi:hypothetical protein
MKTCIIFIAIIVLSIRHDIESTRDKECGHLNRVMINDVIYCEYNGSTYKPYRLKKTGIIK